MWCIPEGVRIVNATKTAQLLEEIRTVLRLFCPSEAGKQDTVGLVVERVIYQKGSKDVMFLPGLL